MDWTDHDARDYCPWHKRLDCPWHKGLECPWRKGQDCPWRNSDTAYDIPLWSSVTQYTVGISIDTATFCLVWHNNVFRHRLGHQAHNKFKNKTYWCIKVLNSSVMFKIRYMFKILQKITHNCSQLSIWRKLTSVHSPRLSWTVIRLGASMIIMSVNL